MIKTGGHFEGLGAKRMEIETRDTYSSIIKKNRKRKKYLPESQAGGLKGNWEHLWREVGTDEETGAQTLYP